MISMRTGLLAVVFAATAQANAATITYDHTMANWPDWSSSLTKVPALSSTDYLNGLSGAITAVTGSTCHPAGCELTAAGLAILNDGAGATSSNAYSLDNNKQTLIVGTEGDSTSYTRLLIDLQQTVNVQQFNSYNVISTDGNRNYQRYNLYGSNAATAPTTADGWSLIANVATDNLWTPTPADNHQTGGASVSGIDANYRYLLFDAHNEGVAGVGGTAYCGTHYVELDVVGTAVPEPGSVALLVSALISLLAYASKRRK